MRSALDDQVDAIYYCPHRDEHRCECRKPKAGMLRAGSRDFGIALERSIIVGDSDRDVLAGAAAGCRNGVRAQRLQRGRGCACHARRHCRQPRGSAASVMSPCPRVSIVMATYNRAHMLGRGIEALQRQTFTDWELIITDDASTDNTADVVRGWAEREPRIVSLRNEVNLQPSKNYNMAFRRARGEFIAMLDDDDVWCSEDKLERQVAFLETHSDHVGCGGGVIVINPEGAGAVPVPEAGSRRKDPAHDADRQPDVQQHHTVSALDWRAGRVV